MMGEEGPRRPSYLVVGTIVGVHGIRGEVKVMPMTDYPERFRPGVRIYLGREPELIATEIISARPHQNLWLVKLALASDRNAAELLRDQRLLIPEDEAMPLNEHENYVHDLIGLTVYTEQEEVLGRLTEVLFTAANDVYVVRGPEGEILVPALRSVVIGVDLATGRMVVRLPEGLRD